MVERMAERRQQILAVLNKASSLVAKNDEKKQVCSNFDTEKISRNKCHVAKTYRQVHSNELKIFRVQDCFYNDCRRIEIVIIQLSDILLSGRISLDMSLNISSSDI